MRELKSARSCLVNLEMGLSVNCICRFTNCCAYGMISECPGLSQAYLGTLILSSSQRGALASCCCSAL